MYPYLISVYGLGAGEFPVGPRKLTDVRISNYHASYLVRLGPYGLRKFPPSSIADRRLIPSESRTPVSTRILTPYKRATRPGSARTKRNISRVVFDHNTKLDLDWRCISIPVLDH